jgi:hypothetical protein
MANLGQFSECFALRVDAKIIAYPDRYRDPRGK